MYFKIACPLMSNPYNPFCHVALLGAFHLYHVVLFHFFIWFIVDFYTRMGEAPMDGKQNVTMEEAQQILFYEYRRSGTESSMISRSQV